MEKIVINTKSGDYKFLGSELNTFESKFLCDFPDDSDSERPGILK